MQYVFVFNLFCFKFSKTDCRYFAERAAHPHTQLSTRMVVGSITVNPTGKILKLNPICLRLELQWLWDHYLEILDIYKKYHDMYKHTKEWKNNLKVFVLNHYSPETLRWASSQSIPWRGWKWQRADPVLDGQWWTETDCHESRTCK